MAGEPVNLDADVNQILEDCRKVTLTSPESVEFVLPTSYLDLEERPLLGSFQRPLLLRPHASNIDLNAFSAEWLQENEPSRRFAVFSSHTSEALVETVPAVVSRLLAATPQTHPFIGLAKCPTRWIAELGKLSKLNPESIEYEKSKNDDIAAPNAFESNPTGVFVCAMPKGFVFPLRKNSSASAEIMFSTPQARGSIVWLVAHPKGESRALEAAVTQASVVFAVADMATFLAPIYTVVQRPGDLVVFPSGCFFQGLCCDHYSLAVSTMVPAYAQMLLPLLSDEELLEPDPSGVDQNQMKPSQRPLHPPEGIHFNPVGTQPTPRRVGPFSLFPTIRQVLAEAGASGIEVFQIVDIINRDSRFVRTLPPNFTSTLAVLLALNFLRSRTHSKSNGMFEKQYVAPLKSSDLPSTAADRVKWRWVGEKATKERVADVLFELETAFWFAITRHLFRIDWGKKIFEILYDVGTPKQPEAASYSSSQKVELHQQEQERFSHPDFAFEYRLSDCVPVCVGPIDNVASVTMKTSHLVMDRPPAAKVTSVVADAAARLPGGVGSRADVERLLLESRYAGSELRNNADLVRSTVTGALDRMSRIEDPPVKFCREVKLWVYRYRQRLQGDFSPAAEDDLPLRGPKKMYLLANAPIAFPVPTPAVSDNPSDAYKGADDSKGPSAASPGRSKQIAENLDAPPAVSHSSKPRYYGPALMTATKMPGLRTVWWTPSGNRRPLFAGLEPRRAPSHLLKLSPRDHERHELMYRIIRDRRRDGAVVEQDALTLLHKYKASHNGNSSRKRRAAADASSASTAAIIMMHKRSASATHHATVAAAEAVAHHLIAVADPILSSGPPASNLRVLEPEIIIDESIIDPYKRFRTPVFLRDAPDQQVFRSSQTDPGFLEDNSAPSLDSVNDLPLFAASAFDSVTRFGNLSCSFTPPYCFRELELMELQVDQALLSFSKAVRESTADVERLSSDGNDLLKPGAFVASSHDRPVLVASDSQPAHLSMSDLYALRLVELPSAVGYIHWLQDLENAVDERMWYHDWRPKPRFSQKVKNDKAPEALLLTDPWHMYELRSQSILPCNSVEAYRWLRLSCASLPEGSMHFGKILLPAPSLAPPEFCRHRLPMDGRWAPFPWSTLYEEEILYEEPPIEDGRKKRRVSAGKSFSLEDQGDDVEVVPAGKRRAAARAAVAVRSTFDDSGDEEEPTKQVKTVSPYGTRRATLNSASMWNNDDTTSASAVGLKKRKREDTDYVGPYFAPSSRKRNFTPFSPKSEDEKRREKLFAASKARRRNVALPGPENSPHLCCRVVLMKIRGKPWWPAALLTKEGLHHFALKHFNGGEYVWPFRPDESYPWVSEKCINPFVTLQYLDELMDGYHYDAVIDTDVKAEEFMEAHYDSWIDALSTAREFLSDFYELLDGNSQADPTRFKNLPRQIPGVDAPRYGTLEDANNGEIPPIQPDQGRPSSQEPASKRMKVEESFSTRGKSAKSSRGGRGGRGGRGRGRGTLRGVAPSGPREESRSGTGRALPSESDDDEEDETIGNDNVTLSQAQLEAVVPAHSSTLQRRKAGRFVKQSDASDYGQSTAQEASVNNESAGDKTETSKPPRPNSSAEVNSSQESVVPISQQPWTGLSLGTTNSSQSDGEQSNGSGSKVKKRKSGPATEAPDDLTNLIGMTTKRTKTLAAQAAERAALQAYSSRSYFHPRRESKRAAAQAAAAVVASAVAAQAEEDRYFETIPTKSGARAKKSRGSNKGGRPKAPRRNLPKLVFSSSEDNFSDDEADPNLPASDLVEAVKAAESPLSSTGGTEQSDDLIFAALLGLAAMAETGPQK
eukprot:TRINITY_DN801_c0_g1_i1.p1 TRINITY_DN801_c0_g1~~TRINITY_DN801_c0_g1_i1.p1  ORF type:complete len:1821 (-),score=253.73 TRINITY_DN801_c0_g1_i1:3645-9107(-)